MEKIIKFINYWQTLIGAMLGPLLLGIGFFIKSLIEDYKKYRESLRRIEISTTRSIDSFYKMCEGLQGAIDSMKNLIDSIAEIQNIKTFCLDSVNFPVVREVFRDIEISNFKIKSYYLHNKLLWINDGIKEINEINKNFKEDFNNLLRKNELLIALMKSDPILDAVAQRQIYIENIKNFSEGIAEYKRKHFPECIRLIVQANIYNAHLRKRYGKGLFFRWKNEGINFKFFRTKRKMKKFSKNLDSLARIDKIIEKEVNSTIEEINSTWLNIKARHDKK